MISPVLNFLKEELNRFIVARKALVNGDCVTVSAITEQDGKQIPVNGVYLSLINLEEETVGKSPLPYFRNSQEEILRSNPEIKINLFLQFAAFAKKQTTWDYLETLSFLDLVILFFQHKSVFTSANYPVLHGAQVNKISLDPVSLSFEQLNHLWATQGAKYLPSIIYKCRLISYRETAGASKQPLIVEVETSEQFS